MIVFILICFLGIVPKASKSCSKQKNLLSLLNCFSAGIFLAMALLHLLPEGVVLYKGWVETEGIQDPFPLPYMLFLVGFLLVLFVDRVIARAFGHTHGAKKVEPKYNRTDIELPATTPKKTEETVIGTTPKVQE